MTKTNLPNGNKITSVEALGSIIRKTRKGQGLTQQDLAGLCNLGTRFISDLENGKPTIEFGKALKVISRLGLEASVGKRGL